jgi:hypothetical protein
MFGPMLELEVVSFLLVSYRRQVASLERDRNEQVGSSGSRFILTELLPTRTRYIGDYNG